MVVLGCRIKNAATECVATALVITAFLLSTAPRVAAQGATATLSGTVVDESGAVVPGVTITVINPATGLRRQTVTTSEGSFTFPLLPPARYIVTGSLEGFAPIEVPDVVLNVGDQFLLRLRLTVAKLGEVVTVTADAGRARTSPSVGTVIDRQFVENLPLNGRSFQSLIIVTPGVVAFPNSAGGSFSVNGQRASSNYFTVDGVGANVFVTPTGSGISSAGSQPGSAVTGGLNNLLSVDALQEFKIETSTYAPEFGRSPGGQISLVSRAGTNQVHGNLFDYIRNDVFDANDWFANRAGLKKAPMRQNDFGGTIGGPLVIPRLYDGHDRTFFFFSYEGLRLRLPVSRILIVPSNAIRQNAPEALRPLLTAYPLPNGRDFGNGSAEFNDSHSDESTINATSIRIDQALNGNATLFGRYNHSPSTTVTGVSNLTELISHISTLTVGSTQVITSGINNETRVNYSESEGGQSFRFRDYAGAVSLPDDVAFSQPFSVRDSFANYNLLNGSTSLGGLLFVGTFVKNRMRQINIVDNLSFTLGTHNPRVGVDYRYLFPLAGVNQYDRRLTINAATGIATSVNISARQPISFGLHNLSLYAQDAWKLSSRLTLTYGLRWELNTPPYGRDDKVLFTAQGVDDPRTATVAAEGTALFETGYLNFAPRVAVAYQMSGAKGHETTLRGGFGVFYDLGVGPLSSATANSPYATNKILTNQPYPLSPAVAAPVPFGLNPPYVLSAVAPGFSLPYTMQWNVALERALDVNQAVSIAYVGAAGRRLLRSEVLVNPSPDISQLVLLRNGATSDYRSLQLQYQRRLARGLQTLASYTWAHSVDTGSDDTSAETPLTRVDVRTDRGPSNFDVRHSGRLALTYSFPEPRWGGVSRTILSGFSIDALYLVQSAAPVNVITGTDTLGIGRTNLTRPDINPDVALYLNDPSAPGGRIINRAAFSPPAAGRQGTLGRNALRGFPLSQLDLAIRRRFRINDRANLQFRAEFFNVLNQPNFANPVGTLSSSLFGRSPAMARSGLGGLNQLYQVGGPRSVQFALKVDF